MDLVQRAALFRGITQAKLADVITEMPRTDSFAGVEAAVSAFRWRPDVHIVEIASPQRLAPYSLALEADVGPEDDTPLASGRLVVLHNPAGEETWQGTTRFISYTHADIEPEMATDPLMADVAWLWLTDALHRSGADYVAAGGTVTVMASRAYGELDATPPRAEVEMRCSWTSATTGQDARHVAAWQELLCQVAGLEPLVDGITSLGRR